VRRADVVRARGEALHPLAQVLLLQKRVEACFQLTLSPGALGAEAEQAAILRQRPGLRRDERAEQEGCGERTQAKKTH
jgi:hypothetical protein